MSKKLSKEEEQRIRVMMLNNQMILDRRSSIKTSVSGDTSTTTPTTSFDPSGANMWLAWNGTRTSSIDNLGLIVDTITTKDANAYVSTPESAGSIFKKPSVNGEGIYFNTLSAFRLGSAGTFNSLHNGGAFTIYISFKYLAQAQSSTLRRIISTCSTGSTNANIGLMVANLNNSGTPHTMRVAIFSGAGGATGPFDVTCSNNTLVDGEYNELKIVFTGSALTVYVRNSANPTFTQKGTDTSGSGLSASNHTATSMAVGVEAAGFEGYLKHVVIYYRELNASETTSIESWLATETAQQITPTAVDVHLWWGQSNASPGSGTNNATLAATYPELAPNPISNAFQYTALQSGSLFTNQTNYWTKQAYNTCTDGSQHNWTLRMAERLSSAGKSPYFIGCGRGSTGLLDKVGSIDWYADGGSATVGDMYPNFKQLIADGLKELLHVMRKTAVLKSCGQYQGENDTSDAAAVSPAYRLAEENFIKSLITYLNGLGYDTSGMKYYLFHPIFSGSQAADVIGDQDYVMANFKTDFPAYNIGSMTAIDTSGFDFAANHVTNIGASQAGIAAFNFVNS